MKLFNGKKIAGEILEELAADIKKEKIRPVLAVILVGQNEASKLYVKLKKQAAVKVGIEVREYFFDDRAKEEEIIGQIKKLNEDEKVSGIIVQLPLPAMFHTEKIIEVINPKKDVDGFHEQNLKLLEKGEVSMTPVLPAAILLTLKAIIKNNFEGKKMLALVNSDIFGRSLRLVLKNQGADLSYLVRHTCIVSGAEKQIQAADVLIMVSGCPKFIKGDMIKQGAILIDGGITRWSDGKVVGDFDKESVKAKAAYLTPVPGGIGPVTVALLLKNVYLAAKK